MWKIVVVVGVFGLLAGIVYSDIRKYQDLQRRLKKEKSIEDSDSMKKCEK